MLDRHYPRAAVHHPRQMFIDTHTHIYTPEFDDDRHEVVERAVQAGAQYLLLPAIDEASLPQMEAVCAQWPTLCRPMIGLHPTELPDDYMATLRRLHEKLDAPDAPFIAVGEVGVDLYWDTSRRDDQLRAFDIQVQWVVEHRLPLVIHARNAHREIVDTLTPYRDALCGGIFHCFGGDAAEAEELLSFEGFYLGIGGVVTFKKSTLHAVLEQVVPLARIVLETDAPYLAPMPHRGKRNEPSYIPLVAARLADVYGLSAEEIMAQTATQARTLFGL